MSQVVVSYARQDTEIAKRIEDQLVHASVTVWRPIFPLKPSFERDLQEQISKQIERAQCVVVLWSRAAAQSAWVEFEVAQAVKAWASDRLVLAVLDDAPVPRGLRDLSRVTILSASDSGMQEVVERARAIVSNATIPEDEDAASPPSVVRSRTPFEAAPVPDRRETSTDAGGPTAPPVKIAWGVSPTPVVVALIIGTAVAGLLIASIRPHIGGPPRSPGFESPLPLIVTVLVLGATLGAGAVWAWKARSNPRGDRTPATVVTPQAPPASAPQVFISYSRQDARTVEDLVRVMEGMGYPVWIDRASAGAQRYAAPIVRAIKMSNVVALMCSRNAFASDHVIREIYVAGDYKKPFIAFLLDPTEWPDEVRYFLTGFPRLTIDVDANRLQAEIARIVVGHSATTR